MLEYKQYNLFAKYFIMYLLFYQRFDLYLDLQFT